MNNIEILEEFIEQYNASYPEEKECVAIYPEQIQAIENLIKENKELKNKCNELNFKYTAQWVDDNFIPKSKVKEKIEEIQQRKEKDGECELALHGFQREAKIEVLQELLEEGE